MLDIVSFLNLSLNVITCLGINGKQLTEIKGSCPESSALQDTSFSTNFSQGPLEGGATETLEA